MIGSTTWNQKKSKAIQRSVHKALKTKVWTTQKTVKEDFGRARLHVKNKVLSIFIHSQNLLRAMNGTIANFHKYYESVSWQMKCIVYMNTWISKVLILTFYEKKPLFLKSFFICSPMALNVVCVYWSFSPQFVNWEQTKLGPTMLR